MHANLTSRGKVTREIAEDPYRVDFLMFNPFSEKNLVETDVSGRKDCGYVAPFWAVMLTGRNDGQANMYPISEHYKLPCPTASTSHIAYKSNLAMTVTFLANKTALSKGELLMLPYDGGCAEICSVPPSLATSEF